MDVDIVDYDAAGSSASKCVARESTAEVDHIVTCFRASSTATQWSRTAHRRDASVVWHTNSFGATPLTALLHSSRDKLAKQDQPLAHAERGYYENTEQQAEHNHERHAELLQVEKAVHPDVEAVVGNFDNTEIKSEQDDEEYEVPPGTQGCAREDNEVDHGKHVVERVLADVSKDRVRISERGGTA